MGAYDGVTSNNSALTPLLGAAGSGNAIEYAAQGCFHAERDKNDP